MGSISGEDTFEWDSLTPTSARDDKIFVSVRLRPLNERELTNNDVSDWECIDDTTIIFKNTFHERSLFPSAHTFGKPVAINLVTKNIFLTTNDTRLLISFVCNEMRADRVFGPDSPTRQVYEEGAKSIALSVLSGINSTIFAYGQTSSGKTYTMTGITEYAVADIYEYIEKHHEREFVLKFSALEIYNESVKDLLSVDDTALRLLDDPERGTIVENLTDVTLRDSSHLKQLLSVCESHRQVGETTLNETSSRSHQILRLTIESEAREYVGAETSSILTASVNFVDLAGSERVSQTQSANTKLKEGCHINRSLLTLGTVIRKLSKGRNGHIPFRDSKLTRILQNSLGGNAKTAVICTMSPAHAHIEQSRNTLSFASCAKKISTNAQVNVVMSERVVVKQLQRELARLENELRNVLSTHGASSDSTSALKEKELVIEKMDNEIKELKLQRDQAQSRLENYLRSDGEYRVSKSSVDMNNYENSSRMDEYSPTSLIDYRFLEKNDEFLSEDTSPTLYIEKYFGPDPCRGWEKIGQETYNNFEDNNNEAQCIEVDFTKTRKSPSSSDEDVSDPSSKPANEKENDSQDEADNPEPTTTCVNLSIEDSQGSITSEFMNVNEINKMIVSEDCKFKQQDPCFEEVDEFVKSQTVKQSANDSDEEDKKVVEDTKQCGSDWSTEFERQKREIIGLWDSCNIPLVHRTYFFLLFKGDPSDSVYMEVELRRLSFLKNTLHGVTIVKDDPFFTRASSAKALNRERHMLSKLMVKKFSRKERENLYKKWGIDVKSKHRRLKLCRRLWTDVTNMEHVKESAAIVARLVGFKERGQAPKEMFALSLSMKPEKIKPFHWKHSSPSMI